MGIGTLYKFAWPKRPPNRRRCLAGVVSWALAMMLSLAPIGTIIDLSHAASKSAANGIATRSEAMPCHGAEKMIVVGSDDRTESLNAQRSSGRPEKRSSDSKPSCMCTPWCASALLAAVIAVEVEAFVVSTRAGHPATSIKLAPAEQPFEPPRG